MMSTRFFDRFLQATHDLYPSTAGYDSTFSSLMISSGLVSLKASHLEIIRAAVQGFFSARSSVEYQKFAISKSLTPDSVSEVLVFDPKNYSALMSYDFHITNNGPKLVEINTNAAFAILADALNKTHINSQQRQSSDSLSLPVASHFIGNDFLDQIWNTFLNEYHLFSSEQSSSTHRNLLPITSGTPLVPTTIAIVDDDVLQQKLVFEFFAWSDFFKSRGVKNVIIASPEELSFSVNANSNSELIYKDGTKIDLIYNRSTDFFLQQTNMQAMRKAYLARAVCLTPNPHEYLLLADKERLLELANPAIIQTFQLEAQTVSAIQRVLAQSFEVAKFSPDEVWSRRKNLFFKPKRSFGGKAVYRGDKISKKIFDHIMSSDYIAQEYLEPISTTVQVTPAEDPAIAETTAREFKYDVRCYAYQGSLQMMTARLFQGQLTNFKTPGGGFASVQIVEDEKA